MKHCISCLIYYLQSGNLKFLREFNNSYYTWAGRINLITFFYFPGRPSCVRFVFDRLPFLPIHHHHTWLFVGSYHHPSCFLHLIGSHLPFLIYPLSEEVNVTNVIFKSRFLSQKTCCPTFLTLPRHKTDKCILVKIFLEKVIIYRIVIECFHSRGQNPCKFIWTKKTVYKRKEFNSHGTGLEHQYGRPDVMWKRSMGFC